MPDRKTFTAVVLLAAFFYSCAALSPAEAVVSALRFDQKLNGCLVELVSNRRPGEVEAFITHDNWLIITIVGATVDFDRLRSTEPNDLISMCQVVGSRTSVQLSLKLKQEFRSCEVVRGPSDTNVSIALFAK